MAARVVVVTSSRQGEGKTHIASGIARWLKHSGQNIAPLHLSTRTGDAVECPGGGSVCRAAAILAECCGLAPAPEFDADPEALQTLLAHHEGVVVEAPEGGFAYPGCIEVQLLRTETGVHLNGGEPLPLFEADLMPGMDAELAHLPLWRFGGGPRAGVISLPHISNFGEYRMIRGAEWLASPAPGRFGVVFIPACANEGSDLEWLQESGLLGWLADQASAGAKIVVSGWNAQGAFPGTAEHLCEGVLLDHRRLSKVLERRMPAPLPEEAVLDRLAAWVDQWTGMRELAKKLF